jgi:hypothetical protein
MEDKVSPRHLREWARFMDADIAEIFLFRNQGKAWSVIGRRI